LDAVRRVAFALLVLASCKRATADATADAGTPRIAAPLPKDTTPPAAAPIEVRIREAVRDWNAAHAKRDAHALGPLYADKLSHYGKEMPRAEVVKAKEAAFAAAPDFTQSIGKIDIEDGLNPDERLARFIKTVTQKGKTKDYPAFLRFSGDRIIEENDDVDWCLSGDGSGTNERVIPPFTMSGAEAIARAHATKHMSDEQKKRKSVIIDTKGMSCPKVCAKPSYECGFHMRTSDLDATTPSNLVEWLYVDPIEKKLWYQAGEAWKSEPLPPAPK
jgi:hypothetical protein